MPEIESEDDAKWFWDKQWICAIDKKGRPITLIDSSAKFAYYSIRLWNMTIGRIKWFRLEEFS
jgi:hypothetical protein